MLRMQPHRAVALLAISGLALLGCPMPPTRAATMQETASDLNLNTRFGRIEMALEHVAPSAHDAFMQHRKQWGSGIRVVDFELVGAGLKGDDGADVSVRFSWFRPEEQDLRTTTVHQKWRDQKGGWLLVSEERSEGDVGLLGEAVSEEEERIPLRAHAQFPTIRLGE